MTKGYVLNNDSNLPSVSAKLIVETNGNPAAGDNPVIAHFEFEYTINQIGNTP